MYIIKSETNGNYFRQVYTKHSTIISVIFVKKKTEAKKFKQKHEATDEASYIKYYFDHIGKKNKVTIVKI